MNWKAAFRWFFQSPSPEPARAPALDRCLAPAPAINDRIQDAGILFLDQRVFTALKDYITRHNARHPHWRIKEVRCMSCSVTRGLGIRSISDLDGLLFYVENHRDIIHPDAWTALKSDLQSILVKAGIHLGGDHDPVSELNLVRVDGRNRIEGHVFLQKGSRMPKPEEEHISTLVLFRTDRKGRIVELKGNTSCLKPGPVLSNYYKNRGLSKCEARLRLAYLLGALDEPDLMEALTFDTPEDEARLTHLRMLRLRMLGFLAGKPALSPAAAVLVQGIQHAVIAEDPATAWSLFMKDQDPKTLCRALCELLRHRVIKVEATGRGILPLWHQKMTLLVDDEQNCILLHLPDGKTTKSRRGLLARAEALAWRLNKIRISNLPQAQWAVRESELNVDPFLRDCALKYLGSRPDAQNVTLLIGALGDQYDVTAGTTITLLVQAEIPELRNRLCRAIENQRRNDVFCANAISVLGKRVYPDIQELATVVAYLQNAISGVCNGMEAGLRTCYSGILALKRLSRQDSRVEAEIRWEIDKIAAAPRTPKIITGLIRDLFSRDVD